MIRLSPAPSADHVCPYCHLTLDVRDWYIPGMRNLSLSSCPGCRRDYYADLPAGHGLLHPVLLEAQNGKVHDEYGADWFATWLADSYAHRVDAPVPLQTEELRPLRKPILLNCLDRLYGHCLLKLFNAQYYIDRRSDLDLILLIPRNLRWLVPDGAAGVWTLDLPLSRGTEWNDWVAREIKRRLEPFEECWLSIAVNHPHPDDFSVERFTGVKPFPVGEWGSRLERPAVTFIWREDRAWWDPEGYSSWKGFPRRAGRRLFAVPLSKVRVRDQKERVMALSEALRKINPRVDFAVTGMGAPAGLPSWISDLRASRISEDVEKAWCERYAVSHVVVGVHGSNMLLPSAHGGAVLELVPSDRWSNLIQDILVAGRDVRSLLYRTRFLPLETPVKTVAEVLASLLQYVPEAELSFGRPWTDHEGSGVEPWTIAKERCLFLRKWQG
jgi:hypothetical protein